ncbi:hypothetical protein PF005_g28721 [Phytophthora fragariae]|uniref:PiggyBac transposable element-derived protein domain-containing protein n=1 Tax=Phytophthora fragariae TaxID=53985 RepID=A0A6A3VU73_9STRA|nr:hypothetical protein PF009_g29233 [Phytophthora fragariae]KAE9066070.1 hypothetical protein PF007_g28619 [Phytophthora fragariae]KAE9167561.1 hypothetical protein PF005_g28721 [Phytophthora fragariae]KAE9323755.1 hypothetical protein PF001_g3776 [Phytophthora fragariae]
MSSSHTESDWSTERSEDETATWKYAEDFDVSLRLNDVEDLLLSKARAEADVVTTRLRQRMFGSASQDQRRVTVPDILKTWLDDSILAGIKNCVSASLSSEATLAKDELLGFLEVELWLGFYSLTPTAFYDSANSDLLPPVLTAMPEKRYMVILNALGTSTQRNGPAHRWSAPMAPDRNIASAMELLRRLCSEIGFVEGVSLASLDDDMMRLRSQSVDDLGLSHVRNPKKGYGPVNHGIVSLTTGVMLGGHVAFRGDSNGVMSYGLLCLRQMPFAAFSPDDVASVIHSVHGHFFAVLEYKTRVTGKIRRRAK